MALSRNARSRLTYALGSQAHAKEIADMIDAGSGTLSEGAKQALVKGLANRQAARLFVSAVEAGSALSSAASEYLAFAMGDRITTNEILDALAE